MITLRELVADAFSDTGRRIAEHVSGREPALIIAAKAVSEGLLTHIGPLADIPLTDDEAEVMAGNFGGLAYDLAEIQIRTTATGGN